MASRLTLQPDVQYVIHPGWAADRWNALVVALRLSLSQVLTP